MHTLNASGPYEVYVKRFPDDGTREVRVSTGGGTIPHWSTRAHEIVYRTEQQRLMVTGYRIEGNTFVPGQPRLWMSEPIADTGVLANFDLAPDGQRIAASMAAASTLDRQSKNHVTVVLNFFEAVRRRASTR